ncbi:MAG: 7-cyano-7-deazaguanine synthase QueC [Nitrospirae bacterium]|nr:MAG: 7-cyano-7-deazaguanine synthase QueC [Nitrospirota bacterium]
MTSTEKRAVVLLSGGVDSSTTLALAKSEGYQCYALSFDYAQRHRLELEAARRVADALGVEKHLIIRFDLSEIGGSALTEKAISVPKDRVEDQSIPITYVPARNTIFLSFALSWAEVLQAEDIFIGANAVDYSGYPDCRPEYLRAFEEMANLATRVAVEGKMRFKIRAPLLYLTKAEIIKKGLELGLDYSLTWSCYDPTDEGKPCGHCDSCLFRKKGFEEAGAKDPLLDG